MTTPIDSSSPFTGSGDGQAPPAAAEEFSIRTMKDDLLALQSRGGQPKIISETPPMAKASENILPTPPKKQPEPMEEPVRIFQSQPPIEKIAAPAPEAFATKSVPAQPESDIKPASADTKNTVFKVAMTVIAVLILAVIGLGGYYFWSAGTPEQTPPPVVTQPPVETPQPDETPVAITPPAEKYSQEKPNYLPLDPATLSGESVKKSLAAASAELGAKAAEKPYEFVAVDTDNNPLAFSAFAAAVKLDLSKEIMGSLGETFSLFLYSDNGRTRLSVATDIAKKSTLPAALTRQEKTFPAAAAFLFLDAKPETTTGTFKTSTENSAVRYLNLDSRMTLSIDYAIIGNRLILSTSKNTMQAMLDKLSRETITTDNPGDIRTYSAGAVTDPDFNGAGAPVSN